MSDILTSVTGVFTSMANWVSTSLGTLTSVFYTPGVGDAAGELTMLGTLGVAALGVSICFLLMSVIQNFLHFRG